MRRPEIIAHCEMQAALAIQSLSCDRASSNRLFFGGKSVTFSMIATALKDATNESVSEYVKSLQSTNERYRDAYLTHDDAWHYFNGCVDACYQLRMEWRK